MKNKLFFPLILSCLMGLSACENENTGTAKMQIRMTDSPGDFAAVNIDVASVQVSREADGNKTDWITLDQINPGIYNLLDFANGKDTLIASSTLPAGKISQIRLILGPNNTLTLKDGSVKPLKTPSAQQSGLKLDIDAELESDVTYVMLLDFDAAKSVVARGNGQFNLKPVVRTITQAVAGGIKGKVTPAEHKPGIYVISAAKDTIGGFANENGDFLIKGVPAGNYTVKFYTKDDAHNKTVENVSITQNQIKDLGLVVLP